MPKSFKHTVDTLGGGQATYQQCWYASYKMLLKYLKRSSNEIKDKIIASGIDFDDSLTNGLSDTNFKKAGSILGLKGWPGSSFNQEPGIFDFGLSDGAEAFIDILQSGPLWVSRVSGKNYHIVLAVGYDDDESKVIYNNPFPGPNNAVETQLRANLFVRNITAAAYSV